MISKQAKFFKFQNINEKVLKQNPKQFGFSPEWFWFQQIANHKFFPDTWGSKQITSDQFMSRKPQVKAIIFKARKWITRFSKT